MPYGSSPYGGAVYGGSSGSVGPQPPGVIFAYVSAGTPGTLWQVAGPNQPWNVGNPSTFWYCAPPSA